MDSAEFAAWVVQPGDDESKKLVQAASLEIVTKIGWGVLFQRYDEDGEGSLDYREFATIVRRDCKIPAAVVPDTDLRQLFNAVDVDRSASIDAQEFESFICSDALAQDMVLDIFSVRMHRGFQVLSATSLSSSEMECCVSVLVVCRRACSSCASSGWRGRRRTR